MIVLQKFTYKFYLRKYWRLRDKGLKLVCIIDLLALSHKTCTLCKTNVVNQIMTSNKSHNMFDKTSHFISLFLSNSLSSSVSKLPW